MSRLRRTGYSLVELMVSVVIFGACAAPLVGAIAWTSHHAATSERRAAIQSLLQDEIAAATADFDKGVGASRIRDLTVAIGGGCSVDVRVVLAPVSLMSRRYQLTATATWTESRLGGGSRTQSMQFATRLYNE